MIEPLRIVIVDDSALMRRALQSVLQTDQSLRVVGEAANGREALPLIAELRPDVIIMDVRMPVMDGLQTTEQVMAYHPTPILVLTASLSTFDVDITFRMLEAGALDVMEKPALENLAAFESARYELVRRIKLLARVKVVTHLRGRRRLEAGLEPAVDLRVREPVLSVAHVPIPHTPPKSLVESSDLPFVVIGASTGGPRVVRQILAGLPEDFGAAVLVVQHIAEGFSVGMAEWLRASCRLPVYLVVDGAQLEAGVVYVAPDSHHVLVAPGGQLHLTERSEHLQRPSIDLAMQGAAEMFGARAIGVLLTGMGRDGAIGMQAIKRAGGHTVAQNASSCAIYGMPRAAVSLGVVDAILSPDLMIGALQQQIENLAKRV